MEEKTNPNDEGTLQETKLEEGRNGESSNKQGSQPPSSMERQGEDQPDKKLSAAIPMTVEAACSSGENRHGFAYAVENVEAEDLPEFVKQHDNTLSFPEKLMLMLICIEKMNAKEGKSGKSAVVGWTADETAFVIRDKEELTSKWLPRFFAQAKYSSFTRKLYRWGFRKISVTTGDDKKSSHVIFGNLNFRRNHHHLMANMRSITAAKTRSKTENETKQGGMPSDGVTKNVLLPQSTASLIEPGLSANLALLAQLQQPQGPYLRPAAAPTAIGQNTSLVNAWRNASLNPTTNQSSIPQQEVTNPQPQESALSLYLLALSRLQGSLQTPPNQQQQQQLQLSSLLSTLQPSQQAILLGLGINLQQQQQQQQSLPQLQQQQSLPQLQQQQSLPQLRQQGHQIQTASEEERQRLAQIAETFLRFKSNPPPT